jgi:hypothetical protein
MKSIIAIFFSMGGTCDELGKGKDIPVTGHGGP